MAVYTEVSDEELRAFVAPYRVGEVLAFKGIAEGVENSNYFLHAEAGLYILTLYEKRVRADDLPFFLGLMEHLAAGGLPCPLPLRNEGGEALGRLAGRPAALVTFLDGISVKRPGARHCEAVGAALARLHRGAEGFALRRPNALSTEGWAPLLRAAGPRADEVAPGLAERTARALDEVLGLWPENLPRGVIHADLFTDNVLFTGDRVSGLIDFYFACEDALAYDLAICLNAWCFEADGSYNLTKGQALIAGYQTVRPLGRDEAEALPVLCRGAALRFLLTRLVDWLNVPPGALVRPKDPLEYDRRLGHHRRVDHAAEYGYART